MNDNEIRTMFKMLEAQNVVIFKKIFEIESLLKNRESIEDYPDTLIVNNLYILAGNFLRSFDELDNLYPPE